MASIHLAKILVIDDDRKVVESLTQALDRYQVAGVQSGKEGLHILKKPHDFDLVILDVRLPDVTGTDLLKEIKKSNPDLGVIIATGFSTKDVAVSALQGRADDYIEKPFDVEVLENKIKRLLGNKLLAVRNSGTGGDGIEQVKRLLERNYDKQVSLEDAASAACLSPKYLSRVFKEKTGQKFSKYRTEIRLAKAKQLLVESDYDINQIAYRMGYENVETFMKAFKRAASETPSEYRSRMRRKTGFGRSAGQG